MYLPVPSPQDSIPSPSPIRHCDRTKQVIRTRIPPPPPPLTHKNDSTHHTYEYNAYMYCAVLCSTHSCRLPIFPGQRTRSFPHIYGYGIILLLLLLLFLFLFYHSFVLYMLLALEVLYSKAKEHQSITVKRMCIVTNMALKAL